MNFQDFSYYGTDCPIDNCDPSFVKTRNYDFQTRCLLVGVTVDHRTIYSSESVEDLDGLVVQVNCSRDHSSSV